MQTVIEQQPAPIVDPRREDSGKEGKAADLQQSMLSGGNRSRGKSKAAFRSVTRWRRKHRLAILLAGLFLLIFFFPSLFMGRVVSPIDILYHYEPWGSLAGGESQNATLNDIPTSYLTLMTMLKGDWSTFHWNPYIASGVPGFASVGAAVLTPFVFLPTLLLPFSLICSGIILLKFLAAYVFAYLWLREERMGKAASAVGAATVAGSGVVAVWWLWPASNAVVLYPMLFYGAACSFRRPLRSIALLCLAAFVYLLSGFPASMAYGAYAVLLYAIFRSVRMRKFPLASAIRSVAAAALALLIALPFIHPFAALLARSGYLEARDRASAGLFYRPGHLESFIDPYRLGDPVSRDWIGDASLGVSNNFVEATVYVGLFPLLLGVLALLNRRAGARWFFVALLALTALLMFGVRPFPELVGALPGIKYTPLTRLRFVLPLSVGYLAAAGCALMLRTFARRLSDSRFFNRDRTFSRALGILFGLLVTVDLAMFAAHFYPYIKPKVTALPVGPTERFLRQERKPFRIAPYFSYFFPNTAEMIKVEDIRSHFSSEAVYRRMLQRIDPGSWGEFGTVIQFNGLRLDLTDPFLSMLNVRYLIEQPSIDIVRWSIYSNTQPVGPDRGAMKIYPGQTLQRQVDVTDDQLHAIDLVFGFEAAQNDDSYLEVSLIRPETGKTVYRRRLAPEDLQLPKTYIPVRPFARRGNVLLLRLRSDGVRLGLLKTDAREGEAPLAYGVVRFPVILVREFKDGRLFENVANLERFRAVWKLRRSTMEAFLAEKHVDLESEAFAFDPDSHTVNALSGVAPLHRRAELQILDYRPSLQAVRTRSKVPFLFVSSEKVTPELRVSVDGRRVKPLTVNAMFAAVPIEPGDHVVVFSRRVGRGLWLLSLGAAVAVVATGFLQRKSQRRHVTAANQ